MKKFQPEEMREGTRGYERMGDVCKDLGEVVDVLWRSGTREFAISFRFLWLIAVADCAGPWSRDGDRRGGCGSLRWWRMGC